MRYQLAPEQGKKPRVFPGEEGMTGCVSAGETSTSDGGAPLGRRLERARRFFAGPPDFAAAKTTRALIYLNAAVYLGMAAYAHDSRALVGMDPRTMLAFGANYAPFVVAEGHLERLVTSVFLHFSLIHIAFNLYALRQVGPFVERAVGTARFLSMYLVSGIVGSAASALWGWLTNPERYSAGASGAICGVIGTALVLGVRTQGIRGPIVRGMGFWLLVTIVLGFELGSDNAAHVGGALTGALFAALWKRGVVYTRAMQRVIMASCVFVIAASGLSVVLRDATDPWAMLDLDARLQRAVAAFQRGSCTEAVEATERAARIGPRSERVQLVKREILGACRR